MKQALMFQNKWVRTQWRMIILEKSTTICKFFNFSCLFRVSTFFVFVSCFDLGLSFCIDIHETRNTRFSCFVFPSLIWIILYVRTYSYCFTNVYSYQRVLYTSSREVGGYCRWTVPYPLDQRCGSSNEKPMYLRGITKRGSTRGSTLFLKLSYLQCVRYRNNYLF